MRVGMGYDVHRLVEGRKLILGGVDIPYEKGLLGHSDADVLVHAVMDALLGAAALGDIGKHFPDTDSDYKDADSMKLLARVGELIGEQNMLIGNIDSIVVAQRPKLAPYIEVMRENIASVLKIDISQVSVKATTEEKLGFTGEGQGISAKAVCLLETVNNFDYRNNFSVASDEDGCSSCGGCKYGRLKLEYCANDITPARQMWDDIFCDPKEFADYYFDMQSDEKSGNKILLSYYDGVPVGMVHMNFYDVRVGGLAETACYIVGVAVKKEMRGQGIMTRMMNRVISDLEGQGCGLAFLMPERQEYYKGLGFEMVYHNVMLKYIISGTEGSGKEGFRAGSFVTGETGLKCEQIKKKLVQDESVESTTYTILSQYDDVSLRALAEEMNSSLSERYTAFSVRSEEYLRTMCKEHLCQSGDVCVVRSDEGRLCGVFSYDLYDGVMYVERFYSAWGFARSIICRALIRACDEGCHECIITVPEDVCGHNFRHTETLDERFFFDGILVSWTYGKGIMARLISARAEESIGLLKNTSFFDEIV